ncbi:hypothetical protein GCM10009563_10680 [Subtercola frigoramans]
MIGLTQLFVVPAQARTIACRCVNEFLAGEGTDQKGSHVRAEGSTRSWPVLRCLINEPLPSDLAGRKPAIMNERTHAARRDPLPPREISNALFGHMHNYTDAGIVVRKT